MNFQRAPISIVRSIRQVSLVRNWTRLRRGHPLPNIGDYEPDARNDDAPDCLLCEAIEAPSARLRCIEAGTRVEIANDGPIQGRYLDEAMAHVAASAGVALSACIAHRLPVYSIAPASDCDGCPVTLEQLFLPFSADHDKASYLLASFHAFSSEGRFRAQGLLSQKPKVSRQWAVTIDPLLTPAREMHPRNEVVEI